jgi:hypothetical protein
MRTKPHTILPANLDEPCGWSAASHSGFNWGRERVSLKGSVAPEKGGATKHSSGFWANRDIEVHIGHDPKNLEFSRMHTNSDLRQHLSRGEELLFGSNYFGFARFSPEAGVGVFIFPPQESFFFLADRIQSSLKHAKRVFASFTLQGHALAALAKGSREDLSFGFALEALPSDRAFSLLVRDFVFSAGE